MIARLWRKTRTPPPPVEWTTEPTKPTTIPRLAPSNGTIHVGPRRPPHAKYGDIWVTQQTGAAWIYAGDDIWMPLNIDPQRKDY